MNNKVKFLRGTSNEYTSAVKDEDTFYYTTDDEKFYVGSKEITGGGVTVDSILSDTSTNPAQNKVIKAAIDKKADKTTATTDTDGLMSAADKTKLDSADDTYALKSKYGDTTINVGRKAGTDVGISSDAEGWHTTASGDYSHSEGLATIASNRCSHSEGVSTVASGESSHAEGVGAIALGDCSHARGLNTIANNSCETACGKYNESNEDTLFSIGDGTADDARHNAFEITTTGGKLHDKNIVTDDMSLPANGGNADYATNAGNADTVGGIQISDIRQITRNAIQTLPTPPIAECDYFVSNADSTFPYYFGNLSIRYGSYTAEFVAIYQTTGDDRSIWYNLYLGGWVGWKEISTTPIKSTTFGGTTGNDGNIALWSTSEKKIPMYIEIVDCYAIPFLSSSDGGQYMAHAFDSNGSRSNTAVSGTVYYTEI